jgi:hypothetical protein
MFNLEQKILEWRRQMLAVGVRNQNVLDELESHLREDVERQMQSGVSAEQAFYTAAQSIGQPAALQDEFAKAGATKGTRLQKWKEALLVFMGFPLPFPNALTAEARETLELGGKEALGFHHDFIGTEHVLLGLLELKAGVVRGVLQRMGVDHKTVRTEIAKIVGPWPMHQTMRTPPYTPRVKRALVLAGSEAKALRQTHVGPEHIFLGLLREGGGVAAVVLKSLGVNMQTARAEIFKELGRNRPGA